VRLYVGLQTEKNTLRSMVGGEPIPEGKSAQTYGHQKVWQEA